MAPLVPDRSCGTCAVCCTALKIDDPALKKEAGVRCGHLTSTGCGIYETRPGACRAFYCGWRYLPTLDAAWRPDRSGVLIGFIEKDDGTALRLSTQKPEAILQGFVVDFLVKTINRGAPVYFTYAPGQGHGFKTYLNDRISVPAKYGDIGKVSEILTAVMREQEGLLGET